MIESVDTDSRVPTAAQNCDQSLLITCCFIFLFHVSYYRPVPVPGTTHRLTQQTTAARHHRQTEPRTHTKEKNHQIALSSSSPLVIHAYYVTNQSESCFLCGILGRLFVYCVTINELVGNIFKGAATERKADSDGTSKIVRSTFCLVKPFVFQ